MDFKLKHNLIEEKHLKVFTEVSNVLLHLIFAEVWKQQGPKVPLMQKILHQGVSNKSENTLNDSIFLGTSWDRFYTALLQSLPTR